MTVAGWITFSVCAIMIVGLGLGIGSTADNEVKGAIIGGTIGLLLSVIMLIGMLWYYNNTASGSRAYKTQESNFGKGLERTVTVYDAVGNVLYYYEGKIDIDYKNGRILFDDENGKRHVIYWETGTAIVEEK